MRLNKFIAHNSHYSRRKADELIKEGKVKINHTVTTEIFVDVKPEDRVYINGNLLKIKKEYTVIVYNKPKGELVTHNDPQGRKTIYDSLPSKYKHFNSVGRLDYASEGLLLLSDSSQVVDKLMHGELERVYNIKVKGAINDKLIKAMQEGLILDDASKGAHAKSEIGAMEFAPFYAYHVIKSTPTYSKLKVAISEGKNRELRRFFAHFGNDVVDLKRIAYGGIELNALPTGKIRFLSKQEYNSLHQFMKE